MAVGCPLWKSVLKEAWFYVVDKARNILPKNLDTAMRESPGFNRMINIYNLWNTKWGFMINNLANAKMENKPQILIDIAQWLMMENSLSWENSIMENIAIGLQRLGEQWDFSKETIDLITWLLGKTDFNPIKILQLVNKNYYESLKTKWEFYNDLAADSEFFQTDRWFRDLVKYVAAMAGDPTMFIDTGNDWLNNQVENIWLVKNWLIKLFAKFPAQIKLLRYTLALAIPAWLFSMWPMVGWIWLAAVSFMPVMVWILALKRQTSVIWPTLTNEDRKTVYDILWISKSSQGIVYQNDEYAFIFWQQAGRSFEDNGTYSKLTWAWSTVKDAWLWLLSWVGLVDIPARLEYAKYGIEYALAQFRDNDLDYETNINNMKMMLSTQEGKLMFIELAQNVAFWQAGMTRTAPGSLTNWGALGQMMNIFWSRWFNRFTYWTRWLLSGYNRYKYKKMLEEGNPKAFDEYMKSITSEDPWLIISQLGLVLWKAWRIAGIMEAGENDDEDERLEKFRKLIGWLRTPYASSNSSGIIRNVLRAPIQWMMMASGFYKDSDELRQLFKDGEGISVQDAVNLWGWSWAASMINTLLQGSLTYTDLITTITSEREYGSPERWKAVIKWFVNFSNRFNWFVGDEIFLAESLGQHKTYGTKPMLNFMFQYQTNPFKELGTENAIRRYATSLSGSESLASGDGVSFLWMAFVSSKLHSLWNRWQKALNNKFQFENKAFDFLDFYDQYIYRDDGVNNFFENADASGLSILEQEKWYVQYTKDFGTWLSKGLSENTLIRNSKYDGDAAQAMGNIIKNYLWEERLQWYLNAIQQVASAELGATQELQSNYILETQLMLEAALAGKDSNTVNMLSRQFFAFTLEQEYKARLNAAGYKHNNQAPTSVQQLLKAQTFESNAWLARIVDPWAFQNVVLFSIANRNEDARKHINWYKIDNLGEVDLSFDTEFAAWLPARMSMSMFSLAAKNTAEWNDVSMHITDVNNLVNAYLGKIRYDKKYSQEQVELVHRLFVIESAKWAETMRKSWAYTEEDIAMFYSSIYLNHEKLYDQFLQDENVPEELKEGVAKQLFGVHLTTLRSDIEDTVDNPSDFIREYMGEVTDFLMWWWRWWTGSRRVNTNYKQVFNNFRQRYQNNSLSRAFTDYARNIFQDSSYWRNYNRKERDYLTIRARLNATRTAYPVFDLWWVWASTGISRGTWWWKRWKAKELKLPATQRRWFQSPKPGGWQWERRGFEPSKWWETKIKASQVSVE